MFIVVIIKDAFYCMKDLLKDAYYYMNCLLLVEIDLNW